MEIGHILVFFESPDGVTWTPVDREQIPDWLRDPAIVERLMAGEKVRNTEENKERYFLVKEVDRPRPDGQHKMMAAQQRFATGKNGSGLILP